MTKKTFALLLVAALMSVVLTACREPYSPVMPTEPMTEVVTEATTEAVTEVPTEPEVRLNEDLLADIGDNRVRDIPITELFIGLTLSATVSDLEEIYGLTHTGSVWFEQVGDFSSTFVYKNYRIFIYTRNAKDGIEIGTGGWVKNENMLIFDENSTISVERRMFSDMLADLAYQVERVEELIENTQNLAREHNVQIRNVQVFRNVTDLENGIQLYEGEMHYGMIVKVYYNESWAEIIIMEK